LEYHGILTPQQHGFWPGFSCETHLFLVLTIGLNQWTEVSTLALQFSILPRLSAFQGIWYHKGLWQLDTLMGYMYEFI